MYLDEKIKEYETGGGCWKQSRDKKRHKISVGRTLERETMDLKYFGGYY
jgi:hypothetical protein